MQIHVYDSPDQKHLRSPGYNYSFCKHTGAFARWGATEHDDPDWSPGGPEIMDIEVSTVCHQGCRFCYKSNRSVGHNMQLQTFRKVLELLPPTVVQIAIGIGSIDANPDLWDIMRAARDYGLVPNITINGYRMQPHDYRLLVELCGAVAVSCYDHDVCFDAVEHLVAAGHQQVNIHQVLAVETYQDCQRLLEVAHQDPRLKGLGAVVLLVLKPVGRGTSMTPLRDAGQYRQLINQAFQANVGLGFDSCSAPLFLKATEHHPQKKLFHMLAEPCESTLFSLYVDAFAKAYPCSFLEQGFQGIDLLLAKDFIHDVWTAPSFVKWREGLLATAEHGLVEGCRQCPAFNLYPERTA